MRNFAGLCLTILAVLGLPAWCCPSSAQTPPAWIEAEARTSTIEVFESQCSKECRAPRFSPSRIVRMENQSVNPLDWTPPNLSPEELRLQMLERFPLGFRPDWCLLRQLGRPVRAPSTSI
jgi:hypothetical protein